ncbi:MAG: hypothetical protein WDW38_007519 [Sanguina aurantia]
MEKVSAGSLRGMAVTLTRELAVLEAYYRASKLENAVTGELFSCLTGCLQHCIRFADMVNGNAVWRNVPQGSYSSSEVCEMILELGLDTAVLSLMKAVSPLLQSSTTSAGSGMVSGGGKGGGSGSGGSGNEGGGSGSGGSSSSSTARPAPAAAPSPPASATSVPRAVTLAAAAAAAATAARGQAPPSTGSVFEAMVALMNQHLGDGSVPWEVRSDLCNCISISLNCLTAMARASSSAGEGDAWSRRLSQRLLHPDGQLLAALDTYNQRMLLYLLHTKVLRRRATHPVPEPILRELCAATVLALHLAMNLPPPEQLRALRALPPGYLDTACRVAAHALVYGLPATQCSYIALATLPCSREAVSFATILEHARAVRDDEFVAWLLARLTTPCMQRIAHLQLAYLVPLAAFGEVVPCAGDLADRGHFPDGEAQRRHQLLNVRLLLEGMLGVCDREHAAHQGTTSTPEGGGSAGGGSAGGSGGGGSSGAGSGSSGGGSSSASSSSNSGSSSSSRVDRFRRVWGSGEAEDRKLLTPTATNLGAMLAAVVRVGTWDVEGRGALCCRLVGALLRSCGGPEFLDAHMRHELGRGMLAVARLASAVTAHVLRQQRSLRADEQARQLAGGLMRGGLMGGLASLMGGDRGVRGRHADMAGALRGLVTQMLRVGSFCSEGSWPVTGIVGPYVEEKWMVTVKAVALVAGKPVQKDNGGMRPRTGRHIDQCIHQRCQRGGVGHADDESGRKAGA